MRAGVPDLEEYLGYEMDDRQIWEQIFLISGAGAKRHRFLINGHQEHFSRENGLGSEACPRKSLLLFKNFIILVG
jgi:hypothetical protein